MMMTWDAALAEVKRLGDAGCSDAAAMASFCRSCLMQLVGAASPQLVWEGAMKQGLTPLALAKMCQESPLAVHELMWV